jgi:hypothetical protein
MVAKSKGAESEIPCPVVKEGRKKRGKNKEQNTNYN